MRDYAGSEEIALLGNPLGEELMLLNPRGIRRRRPMMRRRRRVTVTAMFPRRRRSMRRNPAEVFAMNPRRRRRGRRRYGRIGRNPIRRRRRFLRNPAEDAFRIGQTPRYIIAGAAGALAGGIGFAASKMLLPPEHDRKVTGYLLHGAVGTLVGMLGGAVLKPLIGKRAVPIMVAGAWTTVLFRVALNHIFEKIKRPRAAVPVSTETTAAGLEGIEDYLSLAQDVDMEGLGQAYQRPEPYDVAGIGQEYAPARSLPAASMPVGRMEREIHGMGRAAVHQEAPELGQAYQAPEPYDVAGMGGVGVYAKQPVTHFTSIW